MAKRIIIQEPDELLRKKSREVEIFDERLSLLIDDLFETMEAADGVGLAAPQVSVLKRVAVVRTEDGSFELVNPIIIEADGEQLGEEGCLSVKGRYGKVRRPDKVKVEAFDRRGNKHVYEVQGFTARAFCHEIDHLDGILFIDKEEKQ
ncbi:MAG: peptide deformylase [Clostridiales bacterium]|nr:peptide deformylase [Clostridiales bacterium]